MAIATPQYRHGYAESSDEPEHGDDAGRSESLLGVDDEQEDTCAVLVKPANRSSA